MVSDECCGTCKWHRTDDFGDWICNNPGSECYGCVTEYNDICDNWEDRYETSWRHYENPWR